MTLIEVLYFEGCPGALPTIDTVESVVRDAKLQGVEIRKVLIEDARAAGRLRFLGSPSVRVDGRDVEPEADKRGDFGLQCRVYTVAGSLRNTPERAWIERALGVTGAS